MRSLLSRKRDWLDEHKRWENRHDGKPLWLRALAWVCYSKEKATAVANGYEQAWADVLAYAASCSEAFGSYCLASEGPVRVFTWENGKRIGFSRAPLVDAIEEPFDLWQQLTGQHLEDADRSCRESIANRIEEAGTPESARVAKEIRGFEFGGAVPIESFDRESTLQAIASSKGTDRLPSEAEEWSSPFPEGTDNLGIPLFEDPNIPEGIALAVQPDTGEVVGSVVGIGVSLDPGAEVDLRANPDWPSQTRGNPYPPKSEDPDPIVLDIPRGLTGSEAAKKAAEILGPTRVFLGEDGEKKSDPIAEEEPEAEGNRFALEILTKGKVEPFDGSVAFCCLCANSIPSGQVAWVMTTDSVWWAHDLCVTKEAESLGHVFEQEAKKDQFRRAVARTSQGSLLCKCGNDLASHYHAGGRCSRCPCVEFRAQEEGSSPEPLVTTAMDEEDRRERALLFAQACDMENVRKQRKTKKGWSACQICAKPVVERDEWVARKGKTTAKRAHLSCADAVLDEAKEREREAATA